MPKKNVRSMYRAGVTLFLPLLFLISTPQLSHSNDKIIQWVAHQMQIKKTYAQPTVQWVKKAVLAEIFKHKSKKSMAHWTAEHGPVEAQKLLRMYQDKAVGIFDPKTEIIYVGRFLGNCQQQAILAHEMVHYFQHIVRGPVDSNQYAADLVLMEREMEATALERRYSREFCERFKWAGKKSPAEATSTGDF